MSKVLLWMGGVLFAIYIVKTEFLNSKTWEPFKNGCVAGGYSEQQCSCLSDYVHERLSDNEVEAILNQQIRDEGLAAKINTIRIAGNLACNIGETKVQPN